jgi:uncharacterized protein YaiE (UPF0345 family)
MCLAAGLTAFLAGSVTALPQAKGENYSHARIVRLSLVEGNVQVSRPEEDDWEKALVNLPIQQGYAIATGRGRAEIEFESGATVRLAENTEIQFNELALADGNRVTRMTLSLGSAIFYANLARNDDFTVLTPGMQVAVPRNSRFRMDVTDKYVNVSVSKGEINVEAHAGSYKLAKGQALLFRATDAENTVVARAGEPDEFDRWSADRDDMLSGARTRSLQYVSAPFRYGVADLSSYGGWSYLAPYGYVWQPWGIAVGWSPYYDGRWVYTRGYGWTWVSYEPWGWVPYHYGRWAHTHRGWVWVAGYLHSGWHPGLVAWVSIGGGRHGWCALSPFDRPGRHHNSNVTVVVNNNIGIVTGGRNQRVDRPRDVRFVDGGPSDRNYFGDVREIRRAAGFGGRNGEADASGASASRPAGFAGMAERAGTPQPSRGGIPNAETGSTTMGRTGFSGGRADSPAVHSTDAEAGFGSRRARETQNEETRSGFGASGAGRSTSPARQSVIDNERVEGRADVRRTRNGDPNSSVEFDRQERRFTNQPAVRPPADDRVSDEPRLRGGFGGRADSPARTDTPLYPSRGEEPRRSYGGSRGSDHSPARTSPPPRSEPSTGGGWGSRSDSSRSSSGSSGGSSGGGSYGGSRPSSPPPSGGGGGFGGSRPSSPPPASTPPPARPSSGSTGRPRT